MSHVNRIRNAIRPFPQVDFTHTEKSRNKVFINRLNGERMNFDTPFGNLSDRDAKDIAEQLTIEDNNVPRLFEETKAHIWLKNCHREENVNLMDKKMLKKCA